MFDEQRSKDDIINQLIRLRQENLELKDRISRYGNVDEQLRLLGERLAWGEHQFDTLLNLIPVGVSICTDLSCLEIRHNPIAAQFLRISDWDIWSLSSGERPELQILRDGKAISHQDLPIQRSMWLGETVPNEEYEFIWTDGVRKICTANATPIFDLSGAVVGAIAVVVDITQKKHRDGLESMTDGFYILDDQWRFTYISPKAEAHLQKSPETLLGRNIWEELPHYVGTNLYESYH